MTACRWLMGGLALLTLAPASLEARPTPTLHPGGAPESPDSLVLEYPARRSPSLLALRSAGPLATAAPEAPDSVRPTVLRLATAGLSGAGSPASGTLRDPPPADAITFSGLKTLSVEVGKNRSASLEQSLDLTVRGTVAGDVEVQAMLSDRRLPFEPDGESRELEDLDRISVSVRAQKAEATMGDFLLEQGSGEFARLNRHLQGVRGAARTGDARWNVAAASAKGERRSLEIHGEEGRQGPYPLLTRALGVDFDGVVAGSEVVWLDGVRQRRGAEDDYVIDYGAATVTFTVRHPITAQSRIAIDFEGATSGYRRNLYAAATQGSSAGRGSWYASYVSEGDDARHPLGAELTAEDRAALSELGDSAAALLPSGVRYAGAGLGSYVWDETDPRSPRWLYLGPSKGDYDVEFTDVGPGRGEYADTTGLDGTRFYRYRGANLGSYLPGRAIRPPSSRSLVDLGGGARLLGAWSLEGEMARSGLDQNALSSRDDGDNEGLAARATAKLDPRSVRVGGWRLGTVRAQAALRSRGARFQPFDRVDPAFEEERWNQAPSNGGEDRQELSLDLEPVSTIALRGEIGHRSLTGGSRSVRRLLQSDIKSWVRALIRWEDARNASAAGSGGRSSLRLDLSRESGWIAPTLSAHGERIEGQEGDSVESRSSRDVRMGLLLRPVAVLRLSAGYGVREGEVVATARAGAVPEEATTWDGGISTRPGASLSIEGAFTRRRTSSAGQDQSTDLAQLAVQAGRPGGPVTSELRYDVTQLRESALVRELRAVQPGSGSYDAYGNPRLGGGYELTTRAGDPATRSRAVVQLRLDAYPARTALGPGRTSSAWRGLGGSSFLRLETLSMLPLGSLEHAFDPGDFLAPETTLRGNLSARQTLEFAPAGRGYDGRAEIGYKREQSSEIESLSSRRDAVDARVSVRHRLPARLRAAWTATYDRSVQSVERGDTTAAYESLVRGRGYELEISRELLGLGQVSLLSRQRRDIDITHGGYYDLWSTGPTARIAAGPRMRVDGRVLWGTSALQGAYAPPNLYVAAPVGSRIDYELLSEYRMRDRISLTFSWNGFKAPGRAGYYTGRFELKGAF